jgi:hypothetical protein
MQLQPIAPGLWRWTVRHPEWEAGAEPESPADWAADVGCVAYETAGSVALIDPLVVGEWAALDELVAGRPVSVLTTIGWHRRSSGEAIARYSASTATPEGVETIELPEAGETIFWLPAPRALVPGDRIIGAEGGGLRLCPESWLRYLPSGIGLAELREQLRPLLDLPVERVLVSHGEPVLEGGHDALAEALAG